MQNKNTRKENNKIRCIITKKRGWEKQIKIELIMYIPKNLKADIYT